MDNSAHTEVPVLACPHCKKPVRWVAEERFRPFCSERCRLIDLGAWASESHRIPGESAAPPSEQDD